MSSIHWPTVVTTTLGSGVIAALCNAGVNWQLARKSKEDDRYEKLYGPLKFNLLLMKLIVDNKDDVINDIEAYASIDLRVDMTIKHVSPLILKWREHLDNIKDLFEKNSGFIRRNDFSLVKDFMDGYVKIQIAQDGQNLLAVQSNRIDQILEAVKNLQNKLL
ncbi:MAG: hypothetical protein AAB390_02375 [Patescibacteria group bacterium]